MLRSTYSQLLEGERRSFEPVLHRDFESAICVLAGGRCISPCSCRQAASPAPRVADLPTSTKSLFSLTKENEMS